MCCHGHQRDEVPEHVWVFQVGYWVPLLGVDEVRKQNGIPVNVVISQYFLGKYFLT